jgi:hypothetical protein
LDVAPSPVRAIITWVVIPLALDKLLPLHCSVLTLAGKVAVAAVKCPARCRVLVS